MHKGQFNYIIVKIENPMYKTMDPKAPTHLMGSSTSMVAASMNITLIASPACGRLGSPSDNGEMTLRTPDEMLEAEMPMLSSDLMESCPAS